MAKYNITLIEGDGIGHEVIRAAKRVLEGIRHDIACMIVLPIQRMAAIGGIVLQGARGRVVALLTVIRQRQHCF